MSRNASPVAQATSLPSLRRNSSSRSSRTTHQPVSPRASAMDSDLNSPNSMMPQRHHPQREPSTDRAAREENEAVLRSWEAEEERLTNQLTRKLERLRVDRAKLEQDLESESEAMVLRLQRQLAMLQQQQQSQGSPETPISPNPSSSSSYQPATHADPFVESLKSENASLRDRLTQAEREFNKQLVTASNYRRELLQLRSRLGLNTNDLTLPPPSSPPQQHKSSSNTSTSSIHDDLASPEFVCEPTQWSGRSTSGTTPSEASYATPLVPINTPAQSFAQPSHLGMSPPPAPAPSLSSSVQDAHAFHPHPQHIQPSGYRRVAEEGQLEPRRNRRSASVASATLNNVAEDEDGSVSRGRREDELVAGEMD